MTLPPIAGVIEVGLSPSYATDGSDATIRESEAHVARVNAAADEVTRAASAWVLADRLADARADELDEAVTLLGRASADARAELQALWGGFDKPDDGTPRPANAALLVAVEHKAQVEHSYQSACELEQDRDDRLRAAARALVKALESSS